MENLKKIDPKMIPTIIIYVLCVVLGVYGLIKEDAPWQINMILITFSAIVGGLLIMFGKNDDGV